MIINQSPPSAFIMAWYRPHRNDIDAAAAGDGGGGMCGSSP